MTRERPERELVAVHLLVPIDAIEEHGVDLCSATGAAAFAVEVEDRLDEEAETIDELIHVSTVVPSAKGPDVLSERLALARARIERGLTIDPPRITDHTTVPRNKPDIKR